MAAGLMMQMLLEPIYRHDSTHRQAMLVIYSEMFAQLVEDVCSTAGAGHDCSTSKKTDHGNFQASQSKKGSMGGPVILVDTVGTVGSAG